MTNGELVETYTKSIKRRRYTNDRENLLPVLPFFMLDAVYQIYMRDILPLDCKHETKRWRNIWSKAYNRVNMGFFRAFTVDQQDEVIDRMDSFGDYIYNHVMVAKFSIMNLIKDYPLEVQSTVSSCLVCSVIAQSAEIIWEEVYLDERGRKTHNHDIEQMVQAIQMFLNSWHRPDRRVDCDKDERVNRAVQVLQNKMVDWLYNN